MRLGAANVYNFYRRTEAEMPAEEDEIREARAEGIDFRFLVTRGRGYKGRRQH